MLSLQSWGLKKVKKQRVLDEFRTITRWWMLYWEVGLGWRRAGWEEKLGLAAYKPDAWYLGHGVSWLHKLLRKV